MSQTDGARLARCGRAWAGGALANTATVGSLAHIDNDLAIRVVVRERDMVAVVGAALSRTNDDGAREYWTKIDLVDATELQIVRSLLLPGRATLTHPEASSTTRTARSVPYLASMPPS